MYISLSFPSQWLTYLNGDTDGVPETLRLFNGCLCPCHVTEGVFKPGGRKDAAWNMTLLEYNYVVAHMTTVTGIMPLCIALVTVKVQQPQKHPIFLWPKQTSTKS